MCSGEIPAVILSVSIAIPRKVSWVDGSSILEVLTGFHIMRATCMAYTLSEDLIELGEPAVKYHLGNGVHGAYHG